MDYSLAKNKVLFFLRLSPSLDIKYLLQITSRLTHQRDIPAEVLKSEQTCWGRISWFNEHATNERAANLHACESFELYSPVSDGFATLLFCYKRTIRCTSLLQGHIMFCKPITSYWQCCMIRTTVKAYYCSLIAWWQPRTERGITGEQCSRTQQAIEQSGAPNYTYRHLGQ